MHEFLHFYVGTLLHFYASIYIVQVATQKAYTVWVCFADGKVTVYDLKTYLDKGVFRKIKDISIFIKKCKIMNDTLAWDVGDNCEDFLILG